MKNIFKKFALSLLLMLCPALASAQQNTLVQTTLSAAVAAPSNPNSPPITPVLVQVASATGITGISLNATSTLGGQNQWIIYVDREAMAVVSVSGTSLQVLRGWNGTLASAHASGQMVLYGRAPWFYVTDPGVPSNGGLGVSHLPCTSTTVYVTPWLNIKSGAQWLCSSVSSTYEPGWNNSLADSHSGDFGTSAAATGAQTIPGPFFRLSGTNAITIFTIPVGFNATAVGSGSFCVYPTGAFTTTATSNIASATTAVAGKTLCFTWNPGTSLFSASY